jgi:hypothetical protein
VVGGSLGGVGTIAGDLINSAGTVAPGNSPGILTISGSYTQGASSTLAVELAGTTLGTQYDQLDVSGTATLGGTLAVNMLAFDVLNWGTRVGKFDAVQLPPLDDGLAWNTSQLYTLGALNVGFVGDYNFDSKVDAADFVVWRDMLGQSGAGLAADGDRDGTIDNDDYNIWRANFGRAAGSGAGLFAVATNGEIPEPNSVILGMSLLICSTLASRVLRGSVCCAW